MPASSLSGVLYMLCAVAAFAAMDLCLKRLVEWYPAMQVTYLRGAASLPLLVGASIIVGKWRDLLPQRWSLHVLRGLLGVATLWLFVYAVRSLSLASAYAIFMSAPLLITALSVPLLKERVGPRRWAAVALGMIGVLVILKPTTAGWVTIGGLAALTAALGYALSALTIRMLSPTDTAAATIVWSLGIVTVVSGAFAYSNWVPLDWTHWRWIVVLGVTGAIGQHCITLAFRHAAPATIAPFEYTALAWGMLFDWLFWATVPSARMLSGASIIVASGLYVIHRERMLTRSFGSRATNVAPS